MKAMMFCVFWHKTTSTEIWWNREKRKIVELKSLLDKISFNNLNSVLKTKMHAEKLVQLRKKPFSHKIWEKICFSAFNIE